jgi:hypothetical protein
MKNEGFASHFFQSPATPAPRVKQVLTDKLRDDAWRIHYGANVKKATCMFCCISVLSYTDKRAWEAGHIVCEKFATNKVIEAYYLVPMCSACNSSMGTINALDYLYDTFKIKSLKTVCTNIYDAFAERNEEHMNVTFERCIWKLIATLFGSEEHMAGGGITCANEPSIYNLLALHQMQILQDEIEAHLKSVSDKSAQMQRLVTDRFKPSKRARLFA